MTALQGLLSSGLLVDIALVVMALEAIALVVARRVRGAGMSLVDIVGHLIAGAMLLLAVRVSVTGGSYLWVLFFLSASFPAHVYDLVRRARSSH